MNVAIIGSGGREHAICCSLKKSKKIEKIYCFPGNAGTEKMAINVKIDINNFNEIKKFVKENQISFLVIGPEEPLVNGIVDYFEKENIKIFGPNKISAQLEGSKIFTKKICQKYKIPTADFGIFKNLNDAEKFLKKTIYPIVVKADGLASGKGVYICKDLSEAMVSIKEIFDGKFGKAEEVLIEEFLKGEEMSYFIISDGKIFKFFQTAQDHKRVEEGDKGKNTGGMGAYSPSRLINNELEEKIINKIIKPTLAGLKDFKSSYRGFLYAGLMIVNNEPYLIEYNVRMGDPECQTILPKLKTDLFEILVSCCEENLANVEIEWSNEKSLCIVLCSKGYPESYKKEVLIDGLEKINKLNGDFIYHAGTKRIKNKVYSNGGRVLNFVSLSNNFEESRNKSISLIKNLNWENGFFRKDIGYKVID
jgi:phosphoribosylamine--glycine ligase